MTRRGRLGVGRWVKSGLLAILVVAAALGGVGTTAAIETHTAEDGDTIESLAEMHGVSVEDLAAANDLDPSDPIVAGQELIMPGDAGTAGASGSSATIMDGILAYRQSRSLSCEYASVYIATSLFGAPIAEEEYIWATPQADNPHVGFRGDIDGPWGVTDDYGIYAEALVSMLAAHGYAAEVSYEPEAGHLQALLDAGRPTLVWIATRGDTGFYEEDAAGNVFKLVPWEHVVVAYGYDADGVYVSDPGPGDLQHLSWRWFLDAWAVMDGMALSIYPTWLA